MILLANLYGENTLPHESFKGDTIDEGLEEFSVSEEEVGLKAE